MAIKALIFDIGGVILQNNGLEQSQAWEAQAGLEKGAIFKFINRSGLGNAATKGHISTQELWSKVSEHFKIDLAQIRVFENDLINNETLNTELVEFLQSMRPQYKTAVLSNAWTGIRDVLNQKYALDKLVDSMFFSSEEDTMKPDTKFYQLVLMRLHIQGYETLFVDNNIINIDGASLLGIHGVHYRDNAQAIAGIKSVIEKQAK